MTCDDTHKSTCSPGSADGAPPCGSPAGRTIGLFGQEVAHASRSAPREAKKATQTPDTSGPKCSGSSASVALSEYLASRLRARFGTDGSMEYRQTWRERITPSGRSYWAHTASARRTSDNGCTGWPTPNSGPQNDNDSTWETRRAELQNRHINGNGFGLTLGMAAQTAGWCSPSELDWKDTPGMAMTATNPDGTIRTRADQLPRQAALAGYATPHASDAKRTDGGTVPTIGMAARGMITKSSGAETPEATNSRSSRGVLNPDLPRWLMGFPRAWCDSAVTAMQSFRSLRRNSSARAVRRNGCRNDET